MDASGNLLPADLLSNYVDFTRRSPQEKLTGKVTVSGRSKGRCRFSAGVQDSITAEHCLTSGWQTKSNRGANGENYTLTEAEIGKVITVAVTSSIETGSLVSHRPMP